jgi:hypothetical protein
MGPGQVEPNEFEKALLSALSQEHPAIHPFVDNLHVLSREFTGVGGFTNFLCDGAPKDADDVPLGLSAMISMPNVPNGMGAVLWCRGGRPKCLELFTYGNDHWEGLSDGFSISGAA